MPSLAITGTIGGGKSVVLRLLAGLLSEKATIFSADEKNSQLLDEDPDVRHLITSRLGKDCYDGFGKPDRKKLFKIITSDPAARETLEEILHPRLQKIWQPMAERHRSTTDSYFLAEIPLLYEKGLEVFFDKTIVVGCTDSVRLARMRSLRSLTSRETADWLKMQSPQFEKITRCNFLLWNDGTIGSLEMQIQVLAARFSEL